MSSSAILSSFAAGELSPELWGRTDLAKFHVGCSTARNGFISYRGGYFSRAGSRFIGQSKQPGSGVKPRLVRFQVSIFVAYVLEFGQDYLRIIRNGNYITETAKVITGITQANPGVITAAAHGFANGDWAILANIAGMTQLNGRTVIVAGATANTFSLTDTFGVPINTLTFGAYTSGGTAARIYTVTTPYAATDLPYLKFAQSANTMSLTLVNPETESEYAPEDLARASDASWTLTITTFTAQIAAPPATTFSSSPGGGTSNYAYVVTAVDAVTGQESVASPAATGTNVNIATTAGSNTIGWTAVAGAVFYNIYKANPQVAAAVPIGSAFLYAGYSFGTQFVDSNIVGDASKTPPLHLNPFARGAITDAPVTAGGAAYVQATTIATVVTATGSGAVLQPVVVGGVVVTIIVVNGGEGYAAGDTVTISDSGGGTGATATLTLGPATGTYPSVVAYFQQRRVYANTLNAPDTYFMSQPGAPYTNFDASNPPIPSDAITGAPWAQQINGINSLTPMPGGLIVGTGLDAWQLSGASGPGSPIEPASQGATPQESNGFSPTMSPIKINDHVLYVQSLGTAVRDFQYNFTTNIYSGVDRTLLSNHLFDGYQLTQWAWAREPSKLVWAVRNDGILLSFTYLQEQEVYAWARHDTRGLYKDVCVATEPPVDAVYTVVQRYIKGVGQWAYYIERMDNRQWLNAEQCWCVDCGLAYPQLTPDATLVAASASGDAVIFSASSAVFDGVTVGAVGQVIRMGGGRATITGFTGPTQVVAEITIAITATLPNDPDNMPLPAQSGTWTIATPVDELSGLDHLEGMGVVALADAAVVTGLTVQGGRARIPFEASQIVVGIGFQAQLQSMELDISGQETLQGRRKHIGGVTARVARSRGVKLGVSQPNSSTLENNAPAAWGLGTQAVGKMIAAPPVQATLTSGDYLPLFTGDVYIPVDGDWETSGMVAAQQDDPLPMNILAFIPEFIVGDDDTSPNG